jgi:hypothetical protein
MLSSPAIESGKPRVIPLTDETLEDETTVKDFLDLVHGKDVMPLLADHERACNMLELLVKYDCPTWLDTCRRYVRLAIARHQESHNAFHMFMLAVKLDDPQAVKEAIPVAGARRWASDGFNASLDVATTRQKIALGIPIDPSTLDEEEIVRLPPKYLVALLRALRKRGNTVGWSGDTEDDWQAVADEFYRVYTK